MRQGAGVAVPGSTASYEVLHSFKRIGRSAGPEAGVIDVNGTLYGTTAGGGWKLKGTVFKVTSTGHATVLHTFGNPGDGAFPVADLIYVNGSLYGTTYTGGSGPCTGGCGTVFKVSLSGREKVIHSFDSEYNYDGEYPEGGLVDINGTLYGTTYEGGAFPYGVGTVFKITKSGEESVLYNFGKPGDGWYPTGNLLVVNGALYGTTEYGGRYLCSRDEGCGTVFEITTSGTESVLHNFTGGAYGDGSNPIDAGMYNLNGTLYGTTYSGGSSGKGTVFEVTASGAEHVVYDFAGGRDGAHPCASLTAISGTLFGTTCEGGAGKLGTVFELTTTGEETVLHSFDGSDGASPYADLLPMYGTLYGTTDGGGKYNGGTVFTLTPY